MAMNWHNLLADDDWGGIGQIVFIVILLILSGLGSLISKIKEKEKASRGQRPPGRGESDAGADEPEMIAALRQAEQEQARAVAAARRAAAQQAAAEQAARVQRPAFAPQRPRIRKAAAPDAGTRSAALTAQDATRPEAPPPAGGRIDLSGADEARRAIIYSEILGAPKALRAGPESWER